MRTLQTWTRCLIAFALVATATLAFILLPVEAAEPDPGNQTCYTATIIIDQDCDGEGDLGWNEVAASWGACWDLLGEMGLEAERNYECWWYPTTNCSSFKGTCEAEAEEAPVPPDAG